MILYLSLNTTYAAINQVQKKALKLPCVLCVLSPAVLWIAMVHVQVKLSATVPASSVLVLITNFNPAHSSPPPARQTQ